jgi:transcription termination factor NusB
MSIFKRKNKKEKVKFKDRPIVKYLKENAPNLLGNSLEFIGDITGIEVVEKLGEKLSSREASEQLTPEQQAYALQLLKTEFEHHAKLEAEITERWKADMTSDNKLSKLARPVILFYSWFILTLVLILEYSGNNLPTLIIYFVESMCLTVTGGYFTLRTVEKRNLKKYKGEKKQI